MYTHRITSLLFFALAACGSLAAWSQKPACSTRPIDTSSGKVCGLTSTNGVSAYLGIQYGVSERWQYPKAFPKSSDTLNATAYGNACPQSLASQPSPSSNSQCKDGRSLGLGESEDCLYLNLWVPSVPSDTTTSPSLPVMVFIHGGGFFTGSGGASQNPDGKPTGNLYDGSYLATTGKVIVVTFNYRLGVLGFLTQSDKYNFGFADQILALKWIQSNIASFGGDPKNVTLFGESAGAMSVGLHALSSPQSSGLFQAGIMESNPLGLPYKTTSEAQELRDDFCSSGLCTTTTTTCDLIEAQEAFPSPSQVLKFLNMPDALMWAPTIDNVYVTGQPMASASKLSVPLILGTNRDEGTSFAYLAKARAKIINYDFVLNKLFDPSIKTKIRLQPRYTNCVPFQCEKQLANVINDYMFTCANRHLAIQATQGANPQPLYLYQFNQVSSFNFWSSPPLPPKLSVPQCAGSVCHADELPYVFNTAGQIGKSFTAPEEALSQTVGGYWTGFASGRNPGGVWPLFNPNSKTYRMIDTSSSTANDPLDAIANCTSLWDTIGYESPQTWSRLLTEVKTGEKKPAH